MADHLLIVLLALSVALEPAHSRWNRIWCGLIAALFAVGMIEDTIIALPGFIAEHYRG